MKLPAEAQPAARPGMAEAGPPVARKAKSRSCGGRVRTPWWFSVFGGSNHVSCWREKWGRNPEIPSKEAIEDGL